MGWGKKKEEPAKEPARTPGRSDNHAHSYTQLVSEVTGYHAGHRVRTTVKACSCGLTNTTTVDGS